MNNNSLQLIRKFFNRSINYILALFGFWIFLALFDMVNSGQHWFWILIIGLIVYGFLIFLSTKFSYYGAFLMSTGIMYFISLQIWRSFFIESIYMLVIVLLISGIPFFGLHFFTRKINLVSKNMIFYLLISYVLTTLLAFYMDGTEAGTDIWVILFSFLSVIFLLLLPLNHSYRQYSILKIVNIADLEVYSKIADELEKKIDNNPIVDHSKFVKEVEKVISEFISSIDSFLFGYYEGSIVHACNVKEGLERIAYDWIGVDQKIKFIGKEKEEAIEFWRNNLTHSNVKKPTSASNQRKKDKKKKKKLNNKYIRENKSSFNKSLRSIEFVYGCINKIIEKVN